MFKVEGKTKQKEDCFQVSKCIWFSIKPSTRKRGILLNYITCEDQWCKVIQCNKWMNFTSPNEYRNQWLLVKIHNSNFRVKISEPIFMAFISKIPSMMFFLDLIVLRTREAFNERITSIEKVKWRLIGRCNRIFYPMDHRA